MMKKRMMFHGTLIALALLCGGFAARSLMTMEGSHGRYIEGAKEAQGFEEALKAMMTRVYPDAPQLYSPNSYTLRSDDDRASTGSMSFEGYLRDMFPLGKPSYMPSAAYAAKIREYVSGLPDEGLFIGTEIYQSFDARQGGLYHAPLKGIPMFKRLSSDSSVVARVQVVLGMLASKALLDGNTSDALELLRECEKVERCARLTATGARQYVETYGREAMEALRNPQTLFLQQRSSQAQFYQQMLWMNPSRETVAAMLNINNEAEANVVPFGRVKFAFELYAAAANQYGNLFTDNAVKRFEAILACGSSMRSGAQFSPLSSARGLSGVTQAAYSTVREPFQLKALGKMYAKHPGFVSRLVAFSPEEIKMAGEANVMRILFGQFLEYTGLSETAGPEEISKYTYPATKRIEEDLEMRSQRRAIQVACAAYLFHIDNGRWPANLEEIKAQLPWLGLEKDPRATADSFTDTNAGCDLTIAVGDVSASETLREIALQPPTRSFATQEMRGAEAPLVIKNYENLNKAKDHSGFLTDVQNQLSKFPALFEPIPGATATMTAEAESAVGHATDTLPFKAAPMPGALVIKNKGRQLYIVPQPK